MYGSKIFLEIMDKTKQKKVVTKVNYFLGWGKEKKILVFTVKKGYVSFFFCS